ncbi:hypothetical protein [Qingshengfaniella alkalisoli]|uniref:Cytochrome C oxidase assembly protein n=1 Tax=Qingshengfaniella alkalisoli TaxID=2599296 RepID=A0A5B8J4Q7_9RHOB|nr:hypothetical protein [Qingshengfaniella alkalisoli]QDY69517.1 hypothetical protein FPZ52_07710 [Qingshengfaniella alkalisoli]
MEFPKEHELHRRRFGRNLGVGLCLLGFVAIIFGLTVAKVTSGNMSEGFDHAVRPSLTVEGDQ